MAAAKRQSARITPAIEDYLKAIYLLQQPGSSWVTMATLGEQLGGFKPGSVTGMIKRLAEMNLVHHTPYQGVALTAEGEKIALEVIRHHRLLELYLVEALGYEWDEVHEEADTLEHHISEKLEQRIAAYLGEPTVDPHGDPIPAVDGTLPDRTTACLVDIPTGSLVCIARVRDQNVEHLRYLAQIGLVPGVVIEIIERAPFDGPISVRIDEMIRALDRRLARTIFVEQHDPPP